LIVNEGTNEVPLYIVLRSEVPPLDVLDFFVATLADPWPWRRLVPNSWKRKGAAHEPVPLRRGKQPRIIPRSKSKYGLCRRKFAFLFRKMRATCGGWFGSAGVVLGCV
jgi:hypothetical protein